METTKLIVIQKSIYGDSNVDETDDHFWGHYDVVEEYKLYSSKPYIFFNHDNWIEASYLCKCELDTKSYASKVQSAIEARDCYSSENGNFQKQIEYLGCLPYAYFEYYIDHCRWWNDSYRKNQFKTIRICQILNAYLGKKVYEPADLTNNILARFFGEGGRPFAGYYDPKIDGCQYEIEPYINSNVSTFKKPSLIQNDEVVIYICLPSKISKVNKDSETKYFISGNFEGFENLIPSDIKQYICNIVTRDTLFKGDAIKRIVSLINNRLDEMSIYDNYQKYKPVFKIGNELICKYGLTLEGFCPNFIVPQEWRKGEEWLRIRNMIRGLLYENGSCPGF